MTDYSAILVDAYLVSSESQDPSTQTGAVLLDRDGCEIGRGCNDFPYGVSGDHWHGPKDAKYARVVHSEVAAILSAALSGYATGYSTLVAPWAACANCAKHIAYAGVATLVRHPFLSNGVTAGNQWYDDCMVGDDILREAGVEIIEVDPVIKGTGIRLRRNGSLWP